MQSSTPFELVAKYSKKGCCTESQNLISQNCQKSTKTTSSSISGEKLQKHNISGVVSVCSTEANKPSKETVKSDSNKTSKFLEDFSPNYSPSNWDTPSFTENLNTYDFVTDKREVTSQREQLNGNTEVYNFHGSSQTQGRGPNIHDMAFCDDLSFNNSDTGSTEKTKLIEAKNQQKKFAKNSSNIHKLALQIRAEKSSNNYFNQDSQNLDTYNQDIQSRKQVIQDLRDQLLNKFEDEDIWMQNLKKVRKSMRPLSNKHSIYVN